MSFSVANGTSYIHELGEANSLLQIQRTVGGFAFFSSVYMTSRQAATYFFGTKEKKKLFKFGVQVTSFVHSMWVSLMCLNLAFFNPDEAIEKDHLFGLSDKANFIFAICTSFFLFDLIVILVQKKLQLDALIHHVMAVTCYVVVQKPFLHYYSIRMLLYELSTPLLNLRLIMISLNKTETPLFRLVQTCFGLTFIAVRIIYGLPISAYALSEGLEAYFAQSDEIRKNTFALFFIISANVVASLLNVFWSKKLIAKALEKPTKQTENKIKKLN